MRSFSYILTYFSFFIVVGVLGFIGYRLYAYKQAYGSLSDPTSISYQLEKQHINTMQAQRERENIIKVAQNMTADEACNVIAQAEEDMPKFQKDLKSCIKGRTKKGDSLEQQELIKVQCQDYVAQIYPDLRQASLTYPYIKHYRKDCDMQPMKIKTQNKEPQKIKAIKHE